MTTVIEALLDLGIEATMTGDEPTNEGEYLAQCIAAEGYVLPDWSTVLAKKNELIAAEPERLKDVEVGELETGAAFRVIFEALFELTNEVRTLKGQGVITRAQLKNHLKTFIP